MRHGLLKGTYYFGGVDDSKGPLAEASFLNQSSEVSLKLGFASQEYLKDHTTWGLGGRYVFESSKVFLDFDYINKGVTYVDGREVIIDSGDFGFGGYITDTATLSLSYSTNQNDRQYPSHDIGSNTIALDYKQLLMFEHQRSLNLHSLLAVTDYREDSDYVGMVKLGADYYFNNQFSTGLEYTHFGDNEANDTNRFTLNSTYFMNNTFAFYGKLSKTVLSDNDDVDITSITFGIKTRF
ncbi:conserved hypothetical protein [Vibrio chagasii]|nr:conserved hypothetical protein [Vibrio chagasii]